MPSALANPSLASTGQLVRARLEPTTSALHVVFIVLCAGKSFKNVKSLETLKVVFWGLGSNRVGVVHGHPGGVRGPVFLP